MTRKSKLFMTLALLAFVLAGAWFTAKSTQQKAKNRSSQIIVSWNSIANDIMLRSGYQPVLFSRINAITHIAMHDALNAVDPLYETYAYKGRDHEADPAAAAVSAAHTVLVVSFPHRKGYLDERLVQSLASVKDGTAKIRGIALGVKAANAILALRKDDGSDKSPLGTLFPSGKPGEFRVQTTADFIFAPHWRTMKLLSLQQHNQFRSAPPPAVNSEAYAEAFNEVKLVGRKDSKKRTVEQTNVAKFWYGFPEPGWNSVARMVAFDRKLDLHSTARLFALLNIALTDAYMAGWDSKFHFNSWRPYAAIHQAGEDGNSKTIGDPAWDSYEITPPVQEYPSTPGILGNAGATVLAAILGDDTPFCIAPNTGSAEAARNFLSFSQAANENAESRVLSGVNFRFAIKAGKKLGDEVGQWTIENYLRPLPEISKNIRDWKAR